MILLIDSLNKDQLKLCLINGGHFVFKKVYKNGHKTEFFLKSVAEFLNYKRFNAIDKVCVVAGPAGFSNVRVAVTIANALAWSLKIPVGRINVGLSNLQILQQLERVKWSKIVEPFYSSVGV